MKKDIHPKIYTETNVKCACGNTFTTISTVPSIQVDICSSCHPLFTGQHKFIDTEGRIDKFIKKEKNIEAKKETVKKSAKAKKVTVTQESIATDNQASLKDLLKKLREDEETIEKTKKSEETTPAQKEEKPADNV
jgi:large subunit ribosomal protein L31